MDSEQHLERDYRSQPNATAKDLAHIPGDFGLPLMGKNIDFFANFDKTLYQHANKYGLVSKIEFSWQKGVLALGPDNYQKIFLDKERNFSTEMGSERPIGEWIGGGLLFRDFDEHKLHRRIFQTAFKSDAMRAYVPMTNAVMARELNRWLDQKSSPNQTLKAVPFVREMLMNVQAKVFYGLDDLGHDEAEKLSQAFCDLIEKGPLSIFKFNVPPFKYYYGLRGKKYVDDYIRSLIDERRQGSGTDFMSHLVKEKTEEGSYFDDQDLVDHLRFLFFAAFDTTTTLLSHIMMYLALDSDLQNELRQQSLDINQKLGKTVLDYDDLHLMDKIDNAMNEVLRLHPSAPVLMRRSIRECELEGVRIPPNTIIYLMPGYNHRMEEWWDDPWKFDPDRFSPEREEHKRHSYSYVPFGGGAHKCIGMHFAQQNVKLFMHQLLTSYQFSTLENYQLNSTTLPLPKPYKDLPLYITNLGNGVS